MNERRQVPERWLTATRTEKCVGKCTDRISSQVVAPVLYSTFGKRDDEAASLRTESSRCHVLPPLRGAVGKGAPMQATQSTFLCSIPGCAKVSKRRGWCRMHNARWERHGDPNVCLRAFNLPVTERILRGIEKEPTTGCWIWVKARHETGYGMVAMPGQRHSFAHRAAYEAFVGAIPAGLEIDHLCRVRACCNPEHLEPVTRQENARRAAAAKWGRE
jgi:HNH endonuclease